MTTPPSPLLSFSFFFMTFNNTLCARAFLLFLSLPCSAIFPLPFISGKPAETEEKKVYPPAVPPHTLQAATLFSTGEQTPNAFLKCPSMKTVWNCLCVCVCVRQSASKHDCLWTDEPQKKMNEEIGLCVGLAKCKLLTTSWYEIYGLFPLSKTLSTFWR